MKPEITAEVVRATLSYDQDTGLFTWIACGRTAQHRLGTVAGGYTDEGYWRIYLKGWPFKAHRLAFLHMTGKWPAGEVDHINGNKSDNRWSNLRDTDGFVNQQNKRAARSDNETSGLLGVTWNKKARKYQAQIWTRGRMKHLGYFDETATAQEAYIQAKRVMHEGCTI